MQHEVGGKVRGTGIGLLRSGVLLAVLVCALSGGLLLARSAAASALPAWNPSPHVDPNGFTGIACTSSAQCFTSGWTGNVLASTSPASGSWSSSPVAAPNLTNGMYCYSATLCLMPDNNGNVYAWAGSTWSSAAAVGDVVKPIATVACASATKCFALDTEGGMSTSTSPATNTWGSVTNINGSITFQGLDCFSDSDCVATDAAGGVLNWTAADDWAPAHTIDGGNVLTDVSCPSSSLCVAIDDAGNVLTTTTPRTSTSWSAPLNITSVRLNDISCAPGTTTCGIVDVDGKVWSSANAATGPWTSEVLGPDNLTGISCPTTSFCAAVDMVHNIYTSSEPLAADGSGTMTGTGSIAAGASGITKTFVYTAAAGGMNAGELNIDVPTGWTAPTTSDASGCTTSSTGTLTVVGRTIKVANLTLAGGATLTVTYGATSGGACTAADAATAQTSPGAAAFTTTQRSAAGGALTAIGVSPIVTVNPGAPAHLSFTRQPSASNAGGVAFEQQPIVAVTDAFGNIVTSDANSVELSIASGSGTLTGCTAPVTFASGVAAFNGCAVAGSGSFTLAATDAGDGLVATSAPFNVVTAGPAVKLAFVRQPSTASVSGVAFAQQPQVAIQDASGVVVTGYSTPVTLVVTGGSGTLTGCTAPVVPTLGVATFSGCAITGSGPVRLTASSGALASPDGPVIDVSRGDTTPPKAGAVSVVWGSSARPTVGKLTNTGWDAADVAQWSVLRLSMAVQGTNICPPLGTFDNLRPDVRVEQVFGQTSANILTTSVDVSAQQTNMCVAYNVVAYDAAGNRTIVASTTADTRSISAALSLKLQLNIPATSVAQLSAFKQSFEVDVANALRISASQITATGVRARAVSAPKPVSLFRMTGKRVRGTTSKIRVVIVPTKAGIAYMKRHPKLAGKPVKLRARLNIKFASGSVVTVEKRFTLRFPKVVKKHKS